MPSIYRAEGPQYLRHRSQVAGDEVYAQRHSTTRDGHYGVNVSAMVIWRYFCNDYRYRYMFFKSNDYRYRYMEKRCLSEYRQSGDTPINQLFLDFHFIVGQIRGENCF